MTVVPRDPPPTQGTLSWPADILTHPPLLQVDKKGEAELRRVGGNHQGLRASNETPRHPAAARKGLRKAAEEKPASEPGRLFSLWVSVSSAGNVSLILKYHQSSVRRAVGLRSSVSNMPCALCPSQTPPLVLGTLWCLDRNVSAPQALCSPPSCPVTVSTVPVQLPAVGLLPPGRRARLHQASLRIFWLEISALVLLIKQVRGLD